MKLKYMLVKVKLACELKSILMADTSGFNRCNIPRNLSLLYCILPVIMAFDSKNCWSPIHLER